MLCERGMLQCERGTLRAASGNSFLRASFIPPPTPPSLPKPPCALRTVAPGARGGVTSLANAEFVAEFIDGTTTKSELIGKAMSKKVSALKAKHLIAEAERLGIVETVKTPQPYGRPKYLIRACAGAR